MLVATGVALGCTANADTCPATIPNGGCGTVQNCYPTYETCCPHWCYCETCGFKKFVPGSSGITVTSVFLAENATCHVLRIEPDYPETCLEADPCVWGEIIGEEGGRAGVLQVYGTGCSSA
jgi:hypothetical protein